MGKLSKKERQNIQAKISTLIVQSDQAITSLVKEVSKLGDADAVSKRRILKLKQVLLSLRVEYNKIKLGFIDDEN